MSVISFLDNSYACDPRIVRHKEEEKQRKLAEKQAKKDAVRAKVEEEKRVSMVHCIYIAKLVTYNTEFRKSNVTA